ncbi:hypothetical protein RhiirC2_727970 [Rhizophagus irregularis]|uniref:Uncharacterized protein n=1 Tax=Rhizophagus irregularis TaxID=588596 RepID=A0A2N1NZ64_9GLOM|nr:hypothetical protein RhiirC2_727970 [Rhizophagus irregularis]
MPKTLARLFQKAYRAETRATKAIQEEISIFLAGLLRILCVKKTQRAVKIYKLFRKIGVDKIKRVISYSANAISKLTTTQIRTIEQHFGHVTYTPH